jgi:hypothetical protein
VNLVVLAMVMPPYYATIGQSGISFFLLLSIQAARYRGSSSPGESVQKATVTIANWEIF